MLHVLKRALAVSRGVTNATRRMAAGWIFTLLAITSVPTALQPAYAQSYPERPIKIVVPFSPGGPTDVVARLIAQSLSSGLGQNVVVENLAGAGGRIGAKAAASAQPDGYTLLLGGTNVNAMLGALYKNLGFDPTGSFAPIAAICVDSMALAISPAVPADTFEQFVHYAKNNPGKLKYGAPPGIYTHFAGEFFKIKTGTDILFVPYKGGAQAITDVIGGHIDMVFNPKSSLLTHFKAGKLKALAVTSEARWPELPDTPTMMEVGVAGFPRKSGSACWLRTARRRNRRPAQPCRQRRTKVRRSAHQRRQARHRGEDRHRAGFCRRLNRTGARLESDRRRDRNQGRLRTSLVK